MIFNQTTYDSAYESFRNDPRARVETMMASSTVIIIITCSALLSLMGSLAIIVFILKSHRGLRTVYHRIIFGMSFFDVLQSLCMALTTLPMPKDMIYPQFNNGLIPILGNRMSCDIQGFVMTFSACCTICLNPILCIYYFCSICRKMRDDRFRKVIEPSLYVTTICFSLLLATYRLKAKDFNPSPLKLPWCGHVGHSQYPYWCDSDDSPECAHKRSRSSTGKVAAPNWIGVLFLIICALVIFFTMSLIVCNVYFQALRIRSYAKQAQGTKTANDEAKHSNDSESSSQERILRRYRSHIQDTRDAVKSATLYTIAFIAVWHYPVIKALWPDYKSKMLIFSIALRPLQGVFNLVIFLYHNIRRILNQYPEVSVKTAFLMTLDRDNDPEYILSNIALVKIASRMRARQNRLVLCVANDEDNYEDSNDVGNEHSNEVRNADENNQQDGTTSSAASLHNVETSIDLGIWNDEDVSSSAFVNSQNLSAFSGGNFTNSIESGPPFSTSVDDIMDKNQEEEMK